jgi:hypothetical protein
MFDSSSSLGFVQQKHLDCHFISYIAFRPFQNFLFHSLCAFIAAPTLKLKWIHQEQKQHCTCLLLLVAVHGSTPDSLWINSRQFVDQLQTACNAHGARHHQNTKIEKQC